MLAASRAVACGLDLASRADYQATRAQKRKPRKNVRTQSGPGHGSVLPRCNSTCACSALPHASLAALVAELILPFLPGQATCRDRPRPTDSFRSLQIRSKPGPSLSLYLCLCPCHPCPCPCLCPFPCLCLCPYLHRKRFQVTNQNRGPRLGHTHLWHRGITCGMICVQIDRASPPECSGQPCTRAMPHPLSDTR